ncbi:MAG: sigma-54-dependent Fis family transcriptional regulator [Kiritimatiellae bacterium]|nr:sigma-54-dependent Fis family transcriptional regulator [Kiritimatiellia bacterium]
MKRRPSLLIVDDERNTREGLARALRDRFDVRMAEGGTAALELLSEAPADLVLSDIRMPDMDGLTLMRRILARTPQPVVILMTAYGSIEAAVEAMKEGAYDFLTKPVSLDRLEILLRRALEGRSLADENRQLKERLDAQYGMEHITGQSPAMRDIFETIRQVAPARSTVLIEGESGTGKELVAQALHQLSPRSRGPFVAVHCASLSPTLLESELFGHERGAFTGATERRIGRFEMADGGTLFLDEIGEIDASVQVKILRVLEERRFERVGGRESVDVDVRLLAATNRHLADMVREGTFREDLFFRLNVVTLTLPPLRDRTGDLPLLVSRFLKEFAEENQRPSLTMSPDVLEAMSAYSWPGNVRELRNVVERMVVMARGDRLTARDLPAVVRSAAPAAGSGHARAGAAPGTIEDMERLMIRRTLEAHHGNRVAAAAALGISRRTLHRKLNEFGLREAMPVKRGRKPRGAPGT